MIMSIFLYVVIFIVVIGVSAILIMLYALINHREERYDKIIKEHDKQIERIKKKIADKGGK